MSRILWYVNCIVMCVQAGFEIFRKTNVGLIGIRYAAKKVNVKHIAAVS